MIQQPSSKPASIASQYAALALAGPGHTLTAAMSTHRMTTTHVSEAYAIGEASVLQVQQHSNANVNNSLAVTVAQFQRHSMQVRVCRSSCVHNLHCQRCHDYPFTSILRQTVLEWAIPPIGHYVEDWLQLHSNRCSPQASASATTASRLQPRGCSPDGQHCKCWMSKEAGLRLGPVQTVQ
jgi:hypothetical protein